MAHYPTTSSRAIWVIIGAAVLTIALITVAVVLSVRGVQNSPTPTAGPDTISHATLSDSQPTWPAENPNLATTLKALNLPPSGNAVHHHVHIDIAIDGKAVEIPAEVGISATAESPLHSHDSSGIIHIESSDPAFTGTLGEVFDIWGVAFSADSIGGYTANGDKKLTVYVNGQLVTDDPRAVMLNEHAEIFIAFGTADQLPSTIPASYQYPSDL